MVFLCTHTVGHDILSLSVPHIVVYQSCGGFNLIESALAFCHQRRRIHSGSRPQLHTVDVLQGV